MLFTALEQQHHHQQNLIINYEPAENLKHVAKKWLHGHRTPNVPAERLTNGRRTV